jgi:hypothetical protein
MSRQVALGLTLTYPDYKAQNWDSLFKTGILDPISAHDHTGGGSGVQLGTDSLVDNIITGTKFRLANNQSLRARNAANSADVDVLKLTTSDTLQVGAVTTIHAGTTNSVALGTSLLRFATSYFQNLDVATTLTVGTQLNAPNIHTTGTMYLGATDNSPTVIVSNGGNQIVIADGFIRPVDAATDVGHANYYFNNAYINKIVPPGKPNYDVDGSYTAVRTISFPSPTISSFATAQDAIAVLWRMIATLYDDLLR